LSFCCLWQGLYWVRSNRQRALLGSALAGGLALYAKLLAVWIIGPFVLLIGSWWAWQRFQHRDTRPGLSIVLILGAFLAFMLPLLPILFFDWQTGAASDLLDKLGHSYYGVDNRDLLHNLPIRWTQLGQTLRGDHLWYLGGIYSNGAAPWLAGLALIVGVRCHWCKVAPPLILLVLIFIASLVTISDLFVTHYALIQPLMVATVGIGLATWFKNEQDIKNKQGHRRFSVQARQALAICAVLLWLGLDLAATLHYHAALQRSGGLADHSDASYHLAYYLHYQGLGAPLALDWGIDAPVRYLSQGAVTPIEIFGYASPRQPDAEFSQRLRAFLINPQNVYLLHAPTQTVFGGRREQLNQEAKALGLQLVQEKQFAQRDGTPLFEIWRALPQK
jgi:4-amino-4-deoxy-L-arabinose transferase-like glycosyltransferase